jgi:hypothetical protein
MTRSRGVQSVSKASVYWAADSSRASLDVLTCWQHIYQLSFFLSISKKRVEAIRLKSTARSIVNTFQRVSTGY